MDKKHVYCQHKTGTWPPVASFEALDPPGQLADPVHNVKGQHILPLSSPHFLDLVVLIIGPIFFVEIIWLLLLLFFSILTVFVVLQVRS